MAATLVPPPVEVEIELNPSDNDIIGSGGGPGEPGGEPHRHPEPDPERSVTPLSAYRAIASWVIVSIVMLFSTLTAVVEARWVHSQDWVSVRLPHVLYANTAILLLSSLTIERARSSLRTNGSKLCGRWIAVTLLLGLAFVGGQLFAWQELVSRGLYLASNPGSFFIYMITGTHGLHLLGGIALLAFVGFFLNRWTQRAKQETAVGVVALYWHFMDGLWCYLLALLFMTVQQ